ncbi:thiopeptide-type bacteriocin biosynthesis protein [Pseudonocardia sp.]|uniref:thiopeptide-type bacteriocin biosynthesis protein n=1 Tax=Pseudonocardia sp. TaxID=60912 RepID=UPI00260F15F4|nr:thiopeptide-type bacteriocin biosynthesis protein [Pseudonocardia sp.]
MTSEVVTMDPGPIGHGFPVGSDWIALHVFYSSNPNPLLVDCVGPLVEELRRRSLIARYFFIRYWQEGPHIRLRLLPASPSLAEEVERTAREAIGRFIAERPALFEVETDQVDEYHRDMFLVEYGEEEWERRYGEGGMPIQPNNSCSRLPYEPEYDRYGGPAGVDLAEWHFERSSDMVLRLLDSANVHVRTVMFGLSAQLAVVIGLSFRPTGAALARFFHYYSEFWRTAYPDPFGDHREQFDQGYDEVAGPLGERVSLISRAVLDDDRSELAAFVGEWSEHCRDLRDRVVDLSTRGLLVFRTRGEDGTPDPEAREPIVDPDVALGILLSGYLHMTNNRLGVGVHDEAYLAHLLQRSMMDVHGVAEDDLAMVP